MKPTDKIMLICAVVGIAIAGVLYYFFPDLHWGWYAGLAFFVAAIGYQESIKQVAAERLVDRDMHPKN